MIVTYLQYMMEHQTLAAAKKAEELEAKKKAAAEGECWYWFHYNIDWW